MQRAGIVPSRSMCQVRFNLHKKKNVVLIIKNRRERNTRTILRVLIPVLHLGVARPARLPPRSRTKACGAASGRRYPVPCKRASAGTANPDVQNDDGAPQNPPKGPLFKKSSAGRSCCFAFARTLHLEKLCGWTIHAAARVPKEEKEKTPKNQCTHSACSVQVAARRQQTGAPCGVCTHARCPGPECMAAQQVSPCAGCH